MSLQKYELFRNPEKSIFQVNDVRGHTTPHFCGQHRSIVSAWFDPEICPHKRDKTRGTQKDETNVVERKKKRTTPPTIGQTQTGIPMQPKQQDLGCPGRAGWPFFNSVSKPTHTHTPMHTHSQNTHRQIIQVHPHLETCPSLHHGLFFF